MCQALSLSCIAHLITLKHYELLNGHSQMNITHQGITRIVVVPKIIYLLGATAAKAILSTPISLGKLRGKWYEYKSVNLNTPINVLVSYHPAFLLRSPNYKKEAWIDLKMLHKSLNEY